MPTPKVEYLDTWRGGKSVGRKPYLSGERLPENLPARQDNGTLWKDDAPSAAAPKNQFNIVVQGGGKLIIKNR